ncbi:hypothetical protein GE09DRAFT_1212121 [Coniochaeta sp. 2T2.1]|nr:hypothetical protein GE09DRAFT_1212121 [Coniochaeta sp. 2T2.1]
MPKGTKITSASSHGTSSWTKTAKVSAILPDGSPKQYFLKCATGPSARAICEGEFHSATAINSLAPNFTPQPLGWGTYLDANNTKVFFLLSSFHEMDLSTPPSPAEFISRLAASFQRTITLETSWTTSFTHLLEDVIRYDNETNGPWPDYDAACRQIIDKKYAPLEGLGKYDPSKDIAVTGWRVPFVIEQIE